MKQIQRLLIALLAIPFTWACEEDVYPELEATEPQIVIDAWISNEPRAQSIRISETLPYFDSLSNSGLGGARVILLDQTDNSSYSFEDKSDGWYTWSPTTEQPRIGTIGHTYSLYVEINGLEYVSISTMNRVPEIDSISFVYKSGTIYPDGHYAQFWARDFVGSGDTYWIKAFKNGIYLNKPNEINLAYDAGFTAGGNIDGKVFMEFIREGVNPWETNEAGEELPPYSPGDSVRVEIHSISNAAYHFLAELYIQTDRPGGFAELFAVPLANIPTNISAMQESGPEPVGFFNISAVSRLGKKLDLN